MRGARRGGFYDRINRIRRIEGGVGVGGKGRIAGDLILTCPVKELGEVKETRICSATESPRFPYQK